MVEITRRDRVMRVSANATLSSTGSGRKMTGAAPHLVFPPQRGGAGGMNSRIPVVHVVDDDASFRQAVGRLLRASGYEVALYESGDRFLDDPNSKEPGCILLDMRMSGLSGLELQARLRQLDSILPIVFLSGYGDVPST